MHRRDDLDEFLEGNRLEFENGENWALMQSIWLCALEKYPMPKWVADAYIAAYEKIRMAEFKSWDDVFGRPYKKGESLSAIRKQRKHLSNVLMRIREIRKAEPKTPIDSALFERVGKEFGLGKTLTSEYYYQAMEAFPWEAPLPRK